MMKYVHVVPHSHWDREWYFTIEDSNLMFEENIEYLMHVLETDENFPVYVMDGQVSMIEDYLRLHPENRERLLSLISSGRLMAGPWYTQTDTLLVNVESLIHNLLYGIKTAGSYGRCMDVGYLPDVFGQNQYLPSVFRAFGLSSAVLQRGICEDELQGDLNFRWRSPDGAVIPTNEMYFGYGPGKFLSDDPVYLQERLLPILRKLEAQNGKHSHLLLPAGGDQVLVRAGFPEVVNHLNQVQSDYVFIMSDYETFMAQCWNEEHDQVLYGELIGCQRSRIHHTIKSQRSDIKKANGRAEAALLYSLEPLAALARCLGVGYSGASLDAMWKELFDAHAHDSLGGCNSDDTNEAILNRLKKTERMADGLRNIIMKKIACRAVRKEGSVLLFHYTGKPEVRNCRIVIFTRTRGFTLKACAGSGEASESADLTFSLLKQDALDGGKTIVVSSEGEKEVPLPPYYRSEVLVAGVNCPAFGYTQIEVEERVNHVRVMPDSGDCLQESQDQYITNEFLMVQMKDGHLCLTDLAAGRELADVICLEDRRDLGDSYDYSYDPKEIPQFIYSKSCTGCEKSGLVQRMTVQFNETAKAILTLYAGDCKLYVEIKCCNQKKDHRMRAVIKAGVTSPVSYADQGFSFVERMNENPRRAHWREEGYAEEPLPIYAMEHMVLLEDHSHACQCLAKGMKEYEIIDNNAIALTLFRSVGVLGRDDLHTRPGRASGINNKVVETPDAYMIGEMEFEFCLSYRKQESAYGYFKEREAYLSWSDHYQKQTLNLYENRLERFELPVGGTPLPLSCSVLELEGDVLMSCCKPSYDGEGMIIRLFQPDDKTAAGVIRGGTNTRIRKSGLLEEADVQEALGICDMEIGPKGYQTFYLDEPEHGSQ